MAFLNRAFALQYKTVAHGPEGFDDIDAPASYTPKQNHFLALVRSQDELEVRKFLSSNPQFDVNENHIGRAALRVAIDCNDIEMVDLLLRETPCKVGGSLFTAVREGSKDCVEKLMNLPLTSEGLSQDEDYIGPEDVRTDSYLSPLMLAVHLEEHEIVELFVSAGYRIREPSEDEGEEQTKTNSTKSPPSPTGSFSPHLAEVTNHELSFLRRINAYKALANPIYLAYSFLYYDPGRDGERDLHPIYKIFELNGKLDHMADEFYEFKEEYQSLSDGCEEFAVSLLEQCRTIEEIECLMDVKHEIRNHLDKLEKYIAVTGTVEGASKLTVLNLALRFNSDKIVAHPYSQLQLNNVLYKKDIYALCCGACTKSWRKRNFPTKVACLVRHILLLPFLALIYILLPNIEVSRNMRTPIVKFLSHTGSFIVFLTFLIVSAFQDEFEERVHVPSIVEWIVLVWVVGLMCQEVKELCIQGFRRYAMQWWNFISLSMVLLFVLSYCLRLTAYGISGKWRVLDALFDDLTPKTTYEIILWSNSFFSIAMVLSFFHFLSVLQVNSYLGPLQLSLYRLFGDVLKFLLFSGMIFVSFGLGIRRLYSQYLIARRHFIQKNATQVERHKFAGAGSTFAGLFFSVFGLTELSSFNTKSKLFGITKDTGKVLFGFFLMVVTIVAVNMLIAMMTRSFEAIAENEDLRWKVSRTRMWMNWVDKGSDLPAPFNLIPNPRFFKRQILRLCKWCRFKCRRASYEGRGGEYQVDQIEEIEMTDLSKPSLDEQGLKLRRKTLESIVRRYVHKKKQESHQEDLEMLRLVKAYQEMTLKDLRELRGQSPLSPHRRRMGSVKANTIRTNPGNESPIQTEVKQHESLETNV